MHTFDTPQALVHAVLDAFASSDRNALEALALSESEFHQLIWPELPAARPERNLPWSYVWRDLRQKSRTTLASLLVAHAGRRYSLVDLRATGGTRRYASFDVTRGTELVVRNETGRQQTLRLFGSVLHAKGRYKVFSYVVD